MMLPLPEVREMVEAAKRYLAGEIHFSYLVGPTERCVWWSRVYNAHPAIQQLAKDWQLWVDQVWNEWGQHPVKLPESELRRRIASDLGAYGPAVAEPDIAADRAGAAVLAIQVQSVAHPAAERWSVVPRQDVAALIEAAFAKTPSPGEGFDDISATRQDEGIVDYFRGTTWHGHAVRDLRHHCAALSFFTDRAFRYWLPAFMLASLENPEEADVIPGYIASKVRRPGKLAGFSAEELRAITAFLNEFAERWHNDSFRSAAEYVKHAAGGA